MQTLYKKDSKGRIRQWSIDVEEYSGYSVVATESGLMGGTIKRSTTQVDSTTTMSHKEAAESKMKSAFESKKKQGYCETEEAAKEYKSVKPMLLHRYDKYFDKLKYPLFQQPKLDGICGTYREDTSHPMLLSRKDNEFEKIQSLAAEIANDLDALHGKTRPKEAFQVEIYAHGHTVSEIVEGIKGKRKDVLDKIRLYVVDHRLDDAGMSFKDRLRTGLRRINWGETSSGLLIPIRTLFVKYPEQMEANHERFLQMGFEGSVLIDPECPYIYDSRSYQKQKKKQLFSGEFQILEATYEYQGTDKLIMFICKAENGATFTVRPAWDHKKRMDAFKDKNKFIGKKLTVEYRSVTTYGIPFHPVGIAVRDYE